MKATVKVFRIVISEVKIEVELPVVPVIEDSEYPDYSALIKMAEELAIKKAKNIISEQWEKTSNTTTYETGSIGFPEFDK